VRQGIAPVLVVEYDEDVRDVLHDILTDANYEVTEATTDAAALDFLATFPDGMVVVCSNRDADHHRSAAFFSQVAVDERFTARHQYLMLSSTPSAIPPELQTHLAQLHAAILPKPFDMETLEAYVHEAATRLAHTHPHARSRLTYEP
jgi:CheY-like chemotaxis protein